MEPRLLTYDTKGEGDPLVLLPGGLTGWLSWVPHQDRLRFAYQVIRVQPIHNELGSAGIPGDPTYSRDVERESLRITLDSLEIAHTHLAGWSNGGRAALEFTLAYPERVTSLTLVEPAASWILEKLGESDPSLEQYNRYLAGLAGQRVTEDDLAFFLANAGFAEDVSQARADPFWERALPHRMALSWLSEDLMGSDYLPSDLAGIRCPVLLTKGTEGHPRDRRIVDLIGELVPKGRVVELPGSHAHHVESLDLFLAELEGHLSSGAGS
jgi:pimeloyl-ACP methyl ester carboxylesterase